MRALPAMLAGISALLASAAAAESGLDRVLGRALFERIWVQAPASTDTADGLGPLFNERSCAACHAGGGAARFRLEAEAGRTSRGLVARLGSRDGNPDPLYGRQLQTRSVAGLAAEGTIRFPAIPDGAAEVHPEQPFARATHVSIRQAPALAGRGGFDRVAEAAILAHADPADRDGDGVSGRPHWVLAAGRPAIGRYGWKAGAATLQGQVAEAFALDLGLSSPAAPRPYGDCTPAQRDCLAAPTGESPALDGREVSAEIVALVAAFVAGLPGPNSEAGTEASIGPALFAAAGCAACHVPALADQEGRMVRTYSDLLLHDMGPDLDDGVAEGEAAPAEWRTAPLIGVAEGGASRRYLHDARAANVAAAIGHHGGEAEPARRRFEALPPAERDALVRFVEGL